MTSPLRPRTLTEALRAWSTDEFVGLLQLRPDLAAGAPRDLTELATRAGTTSSIGRALEGLSVWLLLVAEGLAALPDPASADELAALLDRSPAAIRTATAELRRRALVWGADDQLHLVRPVREAFEPYPGGLAPPSPRPLTPTEIDAALAACGDGVRPVLDRLLWCPAGIVRKADRVVSPDTAASPVEALLAHQLLRPLGPDSVVLPREVAWQLRGGRFSLVDVSAEAPVLTGRTRPPDLVNRAAAGAAFSLLHEVEQLAHTLDGAPPRVLRTGGLAARDVTGLARALGTEPAHVTFVLECAAGAGLVATSGSLTLVPTVDYDRWVTQDGPTRWRTLTEAWLTARRFFSRSSEAGGHALGPEAEQPGAPRVRRLLLDLAASTEAGTVIELEQLTEAAVWHAPRLLRTAADARVLAAWTWQEAALLGLVALGARSGFAVAALAHDPLPAPLHELFPAAVDHVVIQADLTAVAPGPLDHGVSADLRLLADQESRGAGAVYRFSAQTLRRAFDAGWSAAEVRAWLAQHSRTPVPQALSYLVEEIGRKHGNVRVGAAGSFVRTDDQAQVATLLRHPDAASLGLREIAPGVLVAAVEPHELVALLREVGHAPVVEDLSGQIITAGTRARAARPQGERRPPAASAEEVVATLLEGDRQRVSRDAARSGADRAHSDLETLRAATLEASTVRIAYVLADGSPTERDLAPLDLVAGAVRAVDRASAQVVTIPLARISSVRTPFGR